MELQLDDIALKQLQTLQKDLTLSRKQYIKVTVLIMLHQGHSILTISSCLGIDDNTVYRHVKAYQKVGLQVYLKNNFVAYQGKLTPKQLKQLDAHLQEYVYATTYQICEWILETFGVNYTPTGLRPLLHRLGFRYKRTRIVPCKADEKAQQAFLESTLPEMLQKVKQGKAQLYYSDGAHPTHNTISGNGWIKKGVSVELPANTGRKRVNINAAINAKNPTELVYDLPEMVNAQSTQRLCEQLLAKHPNQMIYVVCDNARYNRNKMLLEWIADKPIELVYLPPYSPNLNVIERLWRHMREKVLKWQYFEHFEEFRQKIYDFISNLKPHEDALKSLMKLNFQTVGGNSYYSQFN